MTATLDFFYEFASTYSYITAMRIEPLARAAGVTVRWRPFLLGPILKAQGFETSPFNLYPEKGRYMVRDCERICASLGLTFHLPEPFPQHSVLAARVACVGLAQGWGEDVSRAIYHAEFSQRRNIADTKVVAEIVSALGQDADAALALAQSGEVKGQLRTATEDAQRAGIFGAPSFIAAGELYWGNDRLEQAIAAASANEKQSTARGQHDFPA